MNSISGPAGSAAGGPRRPRSRGPAPRARARGRRGSPARATTRSSARSRKFVISAGWPAVAANAAANAIVAVAPIAPSYWLPITTGDVAGEAEVEDPARLGEAGARGLDAHHADRALLERAVDVREADAALVAAERHGPALGEPQPAGAVVDRDRLLDRPHAELDRARRRRARRRRSSSRGWRRRTDRRRAAPRGSRAPPRRRASGARPTLTLKVRDAEPLVDRDRLLGHRRRLAERDHVRGGDVVREAAQQRVARAAEDLAGEVPDGEVDRAARDVVAGRRAQRSATSSMRSGSTPASASLSGPPTASTIEAWVSP